MAPKISRLLSSGGSHNAGHLLSSIIFGSILTLAGFIFECIPLWIALNIMLDVPWDESLMMALKLGVILFLFRIPFRALRLALRRN